MINQMNYLFSFTKAKMSNKLGQRGAEMVEYAIVLACVVAVGVAIYSVGASGDKTLNGVLTNLWTKIGTDAKSGAGIK